METETPLDKNVELKFTERGCPWGFSCAAAGIGSFDVHVYEDAKTKTREIAHFVGGDERVPMPKILSNSGNLPENLVADLYHMARCRREMKRVGTDGPNHDGYASGYKYHRDRFLKNWKSLQKAAVEN